MNKGAGRRTVVFLLAVSILGAAGLRWALDRGIGLNPDSASYMDCAINLARGYGYNSALYRYYRPIPADDYAREAVSPAGVRPRPQRYYLPGYPALVTLLILAGARPEPAALWLAVVLFGLNALVVGLIVHRETRGSTPFAVGAVLIMLGSESMLVAHSQALSEPPFILLCLVCLWLLSRYLETGGRRFLAAAGLVGGLAFLTRYPGAALIGAGLGGLFLLPEKPIRSRALPALSFLALSCLPAAAFILRGYLVSGRFPVHLDHLHSRMGEVGGELLGLASWVVPGSHRMELFSGLNVILAAIVAAVLIVVPFACGLAGARRRPDSELGRPAHERRALFLFSALIPAYLTAFLAANAILKGALLPDIRLLSPMFPALLIVAAACLKERIESLSSVRFRRAAALGLAVYVVVSAGCGAYWMSVCHRQGRGYNNSSFQAPDVEAAMAQVRTLGAVPIFTNDCGALYFQAGRYAYQFPSRAGVKAPAALAEALGDLPACFVYYWTPAHVRAHKNGESRESFEGALIAALGLETLFKSESISVFRRPGRS